MLKRGAAAAIAPFLVMDVIARANARQAALPAGAPGIIHMEVGQPGTGAPRGAVEAASRAMLAGEPLGYTEAFGRRSLREAICRHYASFYDGVTVEPGRIAVTTGASGGFLLAFLSAFDIGDRIAMVSPYYPPYLNILHALGMVPVVLPATEATRFQPTVAMLEQLAEQDGLPDGLIVASPCNPAGTMLAATELAVLAQWCDTHGVRLVSDEIYHGLTWEMPAATAASFSDTAIVINSFSKYWSMTGWRVGWMVLPLDLVGAAERLKQNMFISAPHVSQVAAEAAFACTAEIAANLSRYRRSRDFLLQHLPGAGFPSLSPAQGAFYLYADISARSGDSLSFANRILDETGVAVTPGVDFDAGRGQGFLRFSYCGPEDDMRNAPSRLALLAH
ncbi:pyridoxal phosphate-dependent aminotransferase [Lichenicoccus roseus]|nr:aminotransferase class I/II-fold pyridoxal phosphate-dependent enzyme [Lichenicoccus roseus]